MIPQDNNNDPLMNPIRYLAYTIQQILSYPGTSINSSICTHMIDRKLLKFTQDDLLSSFQTNATSIGEDRLGFKPEDIGKHSNRCDAAMAMFMYDTPA